MSLRNACLVAIAIVLPVASIAAPTKGTPTTEKPYPDISKQPTKPATYGLCDAPQNADAFPSNPVPVEKGNCDNWQKFTATSIGPSTGGTCGGFTVAFGPMGDLHPSLDRVMLRADWGDTPLTAANCAQAKVAAVGWGARCTNDACTTAEWEKIGGPQRRSGFWNSNSKQCYIEVGFNSTAKYKTLNIDVIATLPEDGKTVRKRAKGWIYVSHPNGKCFSTTTKRAEKEKK